MHPDRDFSEQRELLVEREDALAVVRESLAASVRGAGGLLLVAGEAGVGKSALVRVALRSAAADGMTVLAGSGSIVGIGVFAQALGELIPGSGDDRPPTATELLTALAGVVADGPAVLWLDDLQAADEASIDLVVTVADWARRRRLGVIAAHRSEQSPRTPALRRLRETARRQGELRQLGLGPLTAAGTRSLVTAVVGPVPDPVADAVHRCADGIPFHVHELAAALPPGGGTPADVDSSVPDGIRDAVLVRIAGLPSVCRMGLDLAAVAGSQFDTALIDTALIDTALIDTALIDTAPVGADRWTQDPVVRSVLGAIAGADHRLGFRHRLVRSVLLAEIPPGRRRNLQAVLAGALIARGAPAAEIADRYLAAGDAQAAVGWWSAAAGAARLAGTPRVALTCSLLVLQHCSPDDEQLPQRQREAAMDAEAVGDWESAARLWQQVVESAEHADDPRPAIALGRWATALELHGRWSVAIEVRQRAADEYVAQGDPAAAAMERWACGAQLRSAGSFRAAVELLRIAGREAAAGGRMDLQLRCSAHEGNARVRMGEQDGLRMVREALDGALAGGHTAVAADIYQRLADSLEHLGDYRAARQIYEHAVGFCETNAVAGTGSLCHACLTAVLRQTGQWDRAVLVCRSVIDTPGVSRHARAVATGMWGSVLAMRGRTDLARPLLSESSTLARDVGLLAMQILGGWGEALADRADGDLVGAAGHSRRILQLWWPSEDRHYAIAPLRWAASLSAELGDEQDARAQVDGLSRIARDTENLEIRSALIHGHAEISLLEGDVAAAAAGFHRAVAVLEGATLPFERTESLRRSGAALLRLGDHDGAVRDWRAAHRIARRLKATSLTTLLAADLTACGEQVDPRRTGNTVALTRREEEVLRLLCTGRTNREIAAALVLSPRTVETHVANLLAKLGGRSRADASRRAAELGLLG